MPESRRRRVILVSGRNERVLFALGVCALVIIGGFIAYKILEFLADVPIFTFVLIGALFFAYIINPIVAWLHRRIPIAAAILVVYAGIGVVIALIVYVLSPIVARDEQSIAANASHLVAALQRMLTDPHDPIVARLPTSVRDYLHSMPVVLERNLTNYAASLARQTLSLLLSLISLLALFIIIPATAGYMIAEGRGIRRAFLGLLPASVRLRAARIIADLDYVVGGFVRGQILVAIIVGTLVTLLLLGLHVPYAVLIGVFAGIIDVIPYFGALAGWLPAFLAAYTANGLGNALAVTLGIVVINQLEGNVVVPNIVGRNVKLPPLAVILALLFTGEILGLPGLLIAVPAAGVVHVLFVNFTGGRRVFRARAQPGFFRKAWLQRRPSRDST